MYTEHALLKEYFFNLYVHILFIFLALERVESGLEQ